MSVRWGSVSITGNYRENNEDRCLADPAGRFFLVADGMGGQSAGEKASELASELVPLKLVQLLNFENDEPGRVSECIDRGVNHANDEIMALSELHSEYHNMGTTLALLVCVGARFYVAGIGDSPVYLLRDGALQKLTRDHSLSEALLEAGTITREEAARHRYRNVLYRYLGSKEGGTGANARQVDPRSGDRFVLCSDGVSDGIEEPVLAEILGRHAEPQQTAQALVEAAQAGGSKDNITCVVVFVD